VAYVFVALRAALAAFGLINAGAVAVDHMYPLPGRCNIRAMAPVGDPAGGPATLEAFPKLTSRRRATTSSVGDPPGDEDELLAGSWQSSASRARLPRVLTGVRVLVVDDDEDTADLFATALTACGADIVTARSASEALRVIAARVPDVVVTDIAMPDADGYWLVREIRQLADARARAVPVVAVTAFGRQHFRARALAAGFVEHLEKPVDPEVLCLAVARARGR
jgi:CheY-like chemotaxis protein